LVSISGRKKMNRKDDEETIIIIIIMLYVDCICKGKAVPLQAWSGPERFQEINIPRFHDNGTGWW